MRVKLGEVFFIIRNGASIKQTDRATGLPITRIETISDYSIDRNKFGYANIIDITAYKNYLLQDQDILMSHINSEKHLGKSAIYFKNDENEQIIHGMNLLMLRANQKILLPKYAFYFFLTQYFKKQLINIIKKSVNQASFTVSSLKDLEIPLPPLEEQKKIATILDKITDLINKRRQQLSKLDELVKARFVEMFGDPVLNSKNWNKELLLNLTNKIGSGATPLGGRESYYKSGISLIRSMNVHNGIFEYKDLAYINELQATQLNNVIVEENDILFNITGASITRSCIVPKKILPARVNQHVLIIRCKLERINPIFINQQILNDNLKNYLLFLGEANGATRQALTKQQIENLEFIVPPIELQNEFANFVEQTEKTKLAINASLDKLEILKKSLMQKYFG